jgi:hypothetical protein
MKKNLLIVTQNNLTKNFWYQYVDAENVNITIVNDKEHVISEMYMLLPELILLDNYFNPSDSGWLLEIAAAVHLSAFQTRIFCLSPGFSNGDMEKMMRMPELQLHRFNQEFCDSLEHIFSEEQDTVQRRVKRLRNAN